MVIINGREEWAIKLLSSLRQVAARIVYNEYLYKRRAVRNLDLDKVEETITTGSLWFEKCKRPYKLCLKRYYGKENKTYVVMVAFRRNCLEVLTAWLKEGR